MSTTSAQRADQQPPVYNPFEEREGEEAFRIQDPLSTVTWETRAFAQTSFSNVYRGIWSPAVDQSMAVRLPRIREYSISSEQIAVKELRLTGINKNVPEEYERYLRKIDNRLGKEMYIWRRLHDRRITPLLGYIRGTELVDPCLLSPYRKNGNIKIFLYHNTGANRLDLMQQAAEGIQYLHRFNPPIAHCDLKPENILVNDSNEAEICDFGLARALDGTRSGFTSTGGSGGIGTVPYASPEALNGGVDNGSTSTDIYSFASVLVHVLSDKVPFSALSKFKATQRICEGDVPQRGDHDMGGFIGSVAAVNELWVLLGICWSLAPVERPDIDYVVDVVTNVQRGV